MRIAEPQERLASMTDLVIEHVVDEEGTNHGQDYVTGFWARLRGLGREVCRDQKERDGWDEADEGVASGDWREDPQTFAYGKQNL